MGRPLDALVPDLLDQLEEGSGGEGRLADQQLVEDAAKGPEVGRVVVRLLLYQLRGHVERGALGVSNWSLIKFQKSFNLDGGEDEGVEAKVPREAKVAKFGSAVAVKENILRLDVPEQHSVEAIEKMLCTKTVDDPLCFTHISNVSCSPISSLSVFRNHMPPS